jgi:hypothetical protein
MKALKIILCGLVSGIFLSTNASAVIRKTPKDGYIIRDCGNKECSQKGDDWWNIETLFFDDTKGTGSFRLQKYYGHKGKISKKGTKLLNYLNSGTWYIKGKSSTSPKKLICDISIEEIYKYRSGPKGEFFKCEFNIKDES